MSDFTLSIESVEEVPDYNVLVSEFENGQEQRRLKHDQSKTNWKCKSPNLTQTGAAAYKAFFDGKYGALTSFTWTNHIDNTEYTVRFKQGSFKTLFQKGYFRVEFEFERVL